MNILHLFWICPLCGLVGAVGIILCVIAKQSDDDK